MADRTKAAREQAARVLKRSPPTPWKCGGEGHIGGDRPSTRSKEKVNSLQGTYSTELFITCLTKLLPTISSGSSSDSHSLLEFYTHFRNRNPHGSLEQMGVAEHNRIGDVGIGPGAARSAMPKRFCTEYPTIETTNDGKTGTVNRAGFPTRWKKYALRGNVQSGSCLESVDVSLRWSTLNIR